MNVLVVAFDGLDKELIEEFELENVVQEEFGTIDNATNIKEIKTSELFASFITGETYEVHGIEGISFWTNEKVARAEDLLTDKPIFQRFKALRVAIYESVNFLNATKTYPKKEDMNCSTIFEEINNSRALFVPSYNPDTYWVMGPWQILDHRYSAEKICEEWDRRSYDYRKKELFSELETELIPSRDLLIVHFHRPDIYQHIYDGKEKDDRIQLRRIYREIDELAKRIKKKALDKGYDYIIFMSDHGLPTEKGHNENAFYSCNRELFGDETPHITDFHDKILDLVREK